MRPLKFKAWDRFNKKWATPDDLDDSTRMTVINTDVGFRFPDDTESGFDFLQFTGVKDKNEKEIYEEDTLKDRNGIIWTVHFLMGKFGIYCSSEEMFKAVKIKDKNKTEEEDIADDLDAWWVGTEVIGNTYEDALVLEGEQDE